MKVEHTLVSGLEFSREGSVNFARAGTTSATDIFNPGITDPSPGAVTRTGAYTDAAADSFALYAFDTIKLNAEWQLTAGLRWDYFHINYQSVAANGTATPLARTDTMPVTRV